MKKGKHICETLKGIRRDIARANEIDYNPEPCTHEGDCRGTCPRCESEVRWLERQLRVRQSLGKAVTIAGLAVATGTFATSCDLISSGTTDTAGAVDEDTIEFVQDNAGVMTTDGGNHCEKPDTLIPEGYVPTDTVQHD